MVMMDYQEFVDQFRQETARQMAEFERSLATVTDEIQAQQRVSRPKPEVNTSSRSGTVRRHRGRVKGILRR